MQLSPLTDNWGSCFGLCMGHVGESGQRIYRDGVNLSLCRNSGFCSDPLALCNVSLLSSENVVVNRVHDTCGPKKRKSYASFMPFLCQVGFFPDIDISMNSGESKVRLVYHPYGSHPDGITPLHDSQEGSNSGRAAHLASGL